MKRPFRETTSGGIDANYAEFMRRMYAEEVEITRRWIASIVLLCVGIAVCIAVIIILQLS